MVNAIHTGFAGREWMHAKWNMADNRKAFVARIINQIRQKLGWKSTMDLDLLGAQCNQFVNRLLDLAFRIHLALKAGKRLPIQHKENGINGRRCNVPAFDLIE